MADRTKALKCLAPLTPVSPPFGATPVLGVPMIRSPLQEASDLDSMEKKLLNYDNAIRSEAIVIAEYQGYKNQEDIRWNSPPQANFHITTILKGPPLDTNCPVRFAFHTPYHADPPIGWRFDDSKMPEIGSKWILFIEFAALERGQYNTYIGTYGRQPATEANLAMLDQLMDKHSMKLLQSTP
jgi:hypothetical protein